MIEKSAEQSFLENAYKLSTPEVNAEYYDAFASTYDMDFADNFGCHYPAAIAADIRCGIGLVASALNFPHEQIDGIDISVDMPHVSKEKGLYGFLYKVDLTKSLEVIANDYGAALSAGTCTSGHLGPDPLESFLDIARDNALFVIGVKKAFFEEVGFEAVLRDLDARGLIKDLQVAEVPMYAKPGHDHSVDTAFALV
jgi:hypothetical protein